MRRFAVFAIAISVVSVHAVVTPAGATFPGTNGRIALTRSGIVTVLPDGSGAVRLTRGEDHYPTYSPNGSKIAFVRTSSRASSLYVMNADGTKVHRVSGRARVSALVPPRWSPNGRWIAYEEFVSGVDENGDETYKGAITIVRPSGNDQQRLTRFTPLTYDWSGLTVVKISYPSWAPDSRRIFFDRIRGDVSEIFVMDRDGSDKTQLTNFGGKTFLAEVSPDGSKILFTRPPVAGEEYLGNFAIWIMDPDGGNPVQLTDGSRNDTNPRWSPNGTSIAFRASVCAQVGGCVQDLYTMDASGGNLTNLTATDDRVVGHTYTWSPDSGLIAASLRNSNTELDVYVIEVATGEQMPIATQPASEVAWDWQQNAVVPGGP